VAARHPDWQWDRATQGDGMQDGLDSLAQHLGRQLALLQLRTDSDCLRFAVVRRRCRTCWSGWPGPISAWVHECEGGAALPGMPAAAAPPAPPVPRAAKPVPLHALAPVAPARTQHIRRTKNNFRHFGDLFIKIDKNRVLRCHPVCPLPFTCPLGRMNFYRFTLRT
jgi:hypothetical protein